jgi:hypothetical protein
MRNINISNIELMGFLTYTCVAICQHWPVWNTSRLIRAYANKSNTWRCLNDPKRNKWWMRRITTFLVVLTEQNKDNLPTVTVVACSPTCGYEHFEGTYILHLQCTVYHFWTEDGRIYIPLKCWYRPYRPHDVTTQKITIWIFTITKITNLCTAAKLNHFSLKKDHITKFTCRTKCKSKREKLNGKHKITLYRASQFILLT